MSKRLDLSGVEFGNLTVISFYEVRLRQSYWKCRCKCGKEIIVRGTSLTTGNTRGCGCLRNQDKKTHGMSETLFYTKYLRIKERCYNINNKRYKDYGGRGIKCLWKSFEDFRDDMYESYLEHIEKFGVKDTTIERKNVNEHYCKDNCCWATWKEQQNNRTNNRIVEYEGSRKTVIQRVEETGISRGVINSRLKRGRKIGEVLGFIKHKNLGKTRFIEYNGEKKSLEEWAKIGGVSMGRMYNCLHKGYSLDRIFAQSHKNRRNKRYYLYHPEENDKK